MSNFSKILDSTDSLSIDEKESLVSILHHRVSEERREEIVRAVKEARREFKQRTVRPASAAQIMKKLLA